MVGFLLEARAFKTKQFFPIEMHLIFIGGEKKQIYNELKSKTKQSYKKWLIQSWDWAF